MAFDQKEIHAQEFTDIERQVLRVWFDVDQAGNDVLADTVLNAGIQFEHYTSLLDHDPQLRTQAEIAKQQLMAFRLSEQLSQAATFLQSKGKSAGKVVALMDSLPAISEGRFPDWATRPGDQGVQGTER